MKESIVELDLNTDPDQIGKNHIQHGEEAWINDKTGRSLIGQQYLWAIRKWLGDETRIQVPDQYNFKLEEKVIQWLGVFNEEKARLVRLLLARLTWDWKPYEELQHGGEYKELESQICRIDICHYAFPANLDLLLQGIGKMKPVEAFEGCGSCNSDIKKYIEKEFKDLNHLFKFFIDTNKSNKNDLIKSWLIACLLKTIKEQSGLVKAIIQLDI